MTAKITVDRKFLEKQVKLSLKEQVGLTGLPSPELLKKIADDSIEGLSAITDDIMAIPNAFGRMLDRQVLRGGSKARQALAKSNAPFDVKCFFATYMLDRSGRVNPLDLAPETFELPLKLASILSNEKVSNTDPEDIYDELTEFYSSGFMSRLLSTTQASEFVLVSENTAKTMIKVGRQKRLPNKIIVKLFFRRAYIKQRRHDAFMDDIRTQLGPLEFLENDKSTFLNELKKKHTADFGAFFFYSQIDPTLTKSLKEWKKTFSNFLKVYQEVIKQNKEGSNLSQPNWTLILLAVKYGDVPADKLRKVIKKLPWKKAATIGSQGGPVGFVAAVAYYCVIATALNITIDAIDLYINPAGSKGDLTSISENLRLAKSEAIKIIKSGEPQKRAKEFAKSSMTAQGEDPEQLPWEFNTEENERVRRHLLTALDIVIEEFQRSREKSLLNYSTNESAAQLLIFYQKLESIKQTLFRQTIFINEENYDDFQKNINENIETLNSLYKKTRIPFDFFESNELNKGTLLEEPSGAGENTKFEKPTGGLDAAMSKALDLTGMKKKTRKEKGFQSFNNIVIRDEELKVSKLKAKDIEQLVSWYGLRASGEELSSIGAFVAILEKVGQMDEFITDSVKSNTQNASEFQTDFREAWKVYVSPKRKSMYAGVEFPPAIFQKDYSGIGMMVRFRGRNGLWSYRENYTLIAAPLLWNLEKNSFLSSGDTTNTKQMFNILMNYSVSSASGTGVSSWIKNTLKQNDGYNSLMESSQKTVSALNALDSKKINGNLNVILKINLLVTENLKRLENNLFNAENELIRAMKSADAKLNQQSSPEETLEELDKILKLIKKYFIYVKTYSDLEVFFQENNFRFLKDVRIRR